MTRASVDYADLQAAVERLFQIRFPGGEIRGVTLREGDHDDGESVLEITVFFRGEIDGIAENAPLSLLGELKEIVSEHVADGFPLLNFVRAPHYMA